MSTIIYRAVVLLLALLGMTACEQAFLTEINPNAITTDTFWETEKQFNSGLTTVYGATQFQNISGGGLQYEMAMGDIAGTESWYRPTAFRNLTFNDGTYYVTDKWNELYIGIFRANQVIENLQDADPANFLEYTKEEIEAQARFLRAFFYFQVAHTYGGAVMHTVVPAADEDFHKPLSSIEEVTNAIILPDLLFAQTHLPTVWPESQDLGRATWGAATSMIGKVHLYAKNWSEAAAAFKEVIDSDIYQLTPDILDNFTDLNEFNSESIFEVAYSDVLNPGVSGDAVDDSPWETGAEASSIARALGQLNYGGFNTLLVTYSLHELYFYDEVDPSNPVNDGNQQSKRMSASVVPTNGEGLYYNVPIGERGGWGFGQSAYIKKHTNWFDMDAEDVNNRSGINFRHIRLADVYLMYAEAVLMASADVNTAITYIDLVRSRAGVKTLKQYMDESGNMFPQLHVSVQVHKEQPMVAATAENVLTHLQRVERPLELAFEGHRWKDLVRWGIVGEVFTELRADEEWRENWKGLLNVTGIGVAPLWIRERVRPDFFLAAQNYNSERHDYLPIPTQEQQTNKMIN